MTSGPADHPKMDITRKIRPSARRMPVPAQLIVFRGARRNRSASVFAADLKSTLMCDPFRYVSVRVDGRRH